MALVAKSYQNLEQVGEVFTAGGKKYIQVKTSNGSLKTVRVYSEKESTRICFRQYSSSQTDLE